MFLSLTIILLGVEYPMLHTVELQEPTDEQRREVGDLLTEYEIASLKFDRFAALGRGTISTVFEKGRGAEIREFRSVFAEDLDGKTRRMLHSHDIAFREDKRQLPPGYSILGDPHADCLIKLGPPDRMWLVNGGARLADVPKDAKRNDYDPFTSTFRFRSCNNPFCMAQFTERLYIGCKCQEVKTGGFRLENLTGYEVVNGTIYLRWFHAVPGSKDPVLGVNDYFALANGKFVVREEWVGQDHSLSGVLEERRSRGYLQSRSVTKWTKVAGFDVPIEIRSHDGKGLREFEVQFDWLINEKVPEELFDSSTVGRLAVGDYFQIPK